METFGQFTESSVRLSDKMAQLTQEEIQDIKRQARQAVWQGIQTTIGMNGMNALMPFFTEALQHNSQQLNQLMMTPNYSEHSFFWLISISEALRAYMRTFFDTVPGHLPTPQRIRQREQ